MQFGYSPDSGEREGVSGPRISQAATRRRIPGWLGLGIRPRTSCRLPAACAHDKAENPATETGAKRENLCLWSCRSRPPRGETVLPARVWGEANRCESQGVCRAGLLISELRPQPALKACRLAACPAGMVRGRVESEIPGAGFAPDPAATGQIAPSADKNAERAESGFSLTSSLRAQA